MSEEDRELEKLKEKRLAEMQKNISYKQKQDEFLASQKKNQENAPKPRDILVTQLGHRGLEVLENAERQFPNETKINVEQDGKFVSLSDKLSSKFSSSGESTNQE